MLRPDSRRALSEAINALAAYRDDDPHALHALLEDNPDLQTGLTRIVAHTGDASVGAQLGWLAPNGSFGIIDYIGASAPTMHTSKLAVCRYIDAVSPAVRYTYRNRWMRPVDDGDYALDFQAALLVPRGRSALTQDPFEQLRLAHADIPPWLVEALDGLPLTTGAPGVQLRRDTLHLPLLSADPRLHQTLCSSAEQLGFGRIEPTVRERLDALLLAQPPLGRPNLDDLSVLMSMSTRTLRRRLASEGTTTQQVIDDALQQRAEHLLQQGRSAKEVAHTLGFADTSSFSRAFMRWTGKRPSHVDQPPLIRST